MKVIVAGYGAHCILQQVQMLSVVIVSQLQAIKAGAGIVKIFSGSMQSYGHMHISEIAERADSFKVIHRLGVLIDETLSQHESPLD